MEENNFKDIKSNENNVGNEIIDIIENVNLETINKEKYNIFRLDGHNFSKLTKKNFIKPLDIKFNEVMKKCAVYVFEKYNFNSCFVGSDEISLIYYPISDKFKREYAFNGKIFKFLSLLASAVSSKFTELTGLLNEFDCRYFNYDTLKQTQRYLINRRIYTVKNSKMMLAQHYLSENKLKNKSSNEAVNMLLEEENIDYYTLEPSMRRGEIIYKMREHNSKTILDKNGKEKNIEFYRKCSLFGDNIEESIKLNVVN